MSFEHIFLLPEPTIQEILNIGGQPQRDFLTDRYVATVSLANSGLLNSEDLSLAQSPDFQKIYLDDNALMNVDLPKYTSRFNRLRKLLNLNLNLNLKIVSLPVLRTFCDQSGIKRAIDRYGSNIYHENMTINELAEEFGKEAFDTNLSRSMEGKLGLFQARDYIRLLPLLTTSILRFNEIESKFKGQLDWEYLKCLLNVFQSDKETQIRTDIRGNVVLPRRVLYR